MSKKWLHKQHPGPTPRGWERVIDVYNFIYLFIFFGVHLSRPVFFVKIETHTTVCGFIYRGEGHLHSHTTHNTKSQNQNRRSEVKLGQLTFSSLFRPSLYSYLLRQSAHSNNTTPPCEAHTRSLKYTVQLTTMAYKTIPPPPIHWL